jgi:general secretion pathway protein B
MSYILDALKKAERERDAAQIPTLTTVHNMPISQSRRLYLILGISIVCVCLLVGIGLFVLKPSPGAGAAKGGNSGGLAREAGMAVIPDRRTEAPSDVVTTHQTVEPKAQPTGASGIGMEKDVKRGMPSRQVQKESESGSPATNESIRPQAPSRTPPPETTELTSAAPTAPSKPLPLNEAIAKMDMTVLFYAETKSERMVFVDGRRYAEGDYVNGLYLIESITPEGAWLNYQGDRAILRPKAK